MMLVNPVTDPSTHSWQPFSPPDRAYAALIFTSLYLIYLLTFSGVFRTIDELGLYAMAESIVQRGDTATPQVLFAQYHNPVGKIEPGQAILAAPLYALARSTPNVNNLQAAMLVNPIVTALTAAVLYLIGRQLTDSVRRAAALAYVFGLATLAWPYSRTFLREPLLGLLFAAALLAYLKWQAANRVRWLAGMLGILAIATTVKSASIAVIPVFILLVMVDLLRERQRHRRLLLLVGITAIIIMLFGVLITANRSAAASLPLIQYVSGFTLTQMLTTIYGMLLSPGKGIIFYMPVIIAAWMAIARARNDRHLYLGFSVIVPLAVIISYGNNSSWYGGQVWGPRFLVPMLPLMLIPLIDQLHRRSAWILIAISILLQLGPVTADWAVGHRPLNQLQRPWETTIGLEPAYWYLSPPFNQLRLWTASRADLLWAHPMAEQTGIFDPLLPIGLLILIGGAFIIMIRIARRRAHRKEWWLWLPIALMATLWLLLRGWSDAPDASGLTIAEAHSIAAPITAKINAHPTFVTVSNEFHIYPMLGFMKGSFQHFWYSPVEHTDFSELTTAADRAQPVTLTIDRAHLPGDQSGNDLRDWLNQNAYPFGGGYAGGYERIGYVWGPDPIQSQSIETVFGQQIDLVRAGIGDKKFMAGDIVPLQVELRKMADLPEAMAVAVRLIDGNGTPTGCSISSIQAGTLDIAAWPIGATVTDRRGCSLPLDLAAGIYRVEIGIEVPDSVLTTSTGGSFVSIGQIQIDN